MNLILFRRLFQASLFDFGANLKLNPKLFKSKPKKCLNLLKPDTDTKSLWLIFKNLTFLHTNQNDYSEATRFCLARLFSPSGELKPTSFLNDSHKSELKYWQTSSNASVLNFVSSLSVPECLHAAVLELFASVNMVVSWSTFDLSHCRQLVSSISTWKLITLIRTKCITKIINESIICKFILIIIILKLF